MQKLKIKFKDFLKLLGVAGLIVVIVGVLSPLYPLIAYGRMMPYYIFSANLIVAAVLVAGGLIVLILPVKLSETEKRLLDHSTYVERMGDARERKRGRAHQMLYVGLLAGGITMIVELLFSFIR